MKKGQPLHNEQNLQNRKNYDDYHVGRIVKFTCLFTFVVLIVFLAAAFIFRCVEDKVFQYQVLDIVKQNASGIIFTGLSILGINYLRR